MKQKWLIVGALIVSILALAGCGKKKEESFEEADSQAAETGTYHILIHWASGAKEASTWEISGTYDETSGMLSYENGNYTVHTWDENDKETVSEGEVTKGTLMKEGDKLRWSDSKNEEDGLFVKVSE